VNLDAERWASIPDAHHYLVSDEGRVRHMLGDGRWREVKPVRNRRAHGSDGYLKVCLGRGRQEYVHRLVMAAFVGICPDDHLVDHIDHDRTNNSLINLRYLPAAENSVRWSDSEAAAWERDAGRIPA